MDKISSYLSVMFLAMMATAILTITEVQAEEGSCYLKIRMCLLVSLIWIARETKDRRYGRGELTPISPLRLQRLTADSYMIIIPSRMKTNP